MKIIIELFTNLLLHDPPHLHPRHTDNPEAYYRISKLWRVLCFLTGFVHLYFLFLFHLSAIPEMVAYNAFIFFVWIGIVLLVRWGFFYTAFFLSMSEICLHAFLATYFAGSGSLFAVFFIIPPIVGFINPLEKTPFDYFSKGIFIFIPLAAFLVIWNYNLTHGPVYVLPLELQRLLFISNITLVIVFNGAIGGAFSILVLKAENALAREYQRSESLLLNVLPEPIAERLKKGSGTIADQIENVTVVFLDIVDFTRMSSHRGADEIVALLNNLFSRFDGLAEEYGLEKIKTIGDAYMAVAGIPYEKEHHAKDALRMAVAMHRCILEFNQEVHETFRARIGLCSGPVVAGVIGRKKFIYDLWGDTVNTASRMESHGIPRMIQVTESTYELIKADFPAESEQVVDIKGKGPMKTFLLNPDRVLQ